MLIHELLNKDPDIAPYKASLIVLDSKFSICMAKNREYIKHTRHITTRKHFIRNGENCKMHKVDLWGGGLEWAEIASKSVGDPDLTLIIIYIRVILDN